jgi:orotidine-5'-phosphate decarboxylase
MKANNQNPHPAQALLNPEQHAQLKALMAAYDMGEPAIIRHLIASAYERIADVKLHDVFGGY